jgi:branched-chain amino acid transport system substrate-binding protein
MKKRSLFAGLLVMLLVVGITAAAYGTTAKKATRAAAPILIGFNNSLTGVSAAPGVSASKGVQLQIKLINAKGGVLGHKLKLIQYDDRSDMPTAIANLKKLIQQDKVFATVGPFAQYEQEPARQLAEQTHTPMVGDGPATLSQLAGKQYQWSVMTAVAGADQAKSVAKVVKAAGWKNVLGLADVLTIDRETLTQLDKIASGFQFTMMPDSFGFDQTDFQPIINKIMQQINTVKPDAIILYVNPIALPPLYKGLRALNVKLPILAGTACAHPAIFAQGPQAVEGVLTMDSGGIINPSALPKSWPVKKLQLDFVKRYKAAYKAAPDFFSASGADMVTTLVAAMKKAGSLDKAKVAKALVRINKLPTLEGIMTFTPKATSQGIHGYMVCWKVTNGQFKLVKAIP